jgi:molybdopterin synthase sulfur carrier subunit
MLSPLPSKIRAMAHVELTPHLFQFFPKLEGRALDIGGNTVAELIRGLEAIAPGIAFYLCDERGRLRQHVNLYVESERVKDRVGLTDALLPHSRVFIMQALSGG